MASPTAPGRWRGGRIARYGWLFPQFTVGWFAKRRPRCMLFYIFGALGRVACVLAIARLVAVAGPQPGAGTLAAFFTLLVAYAFISGVVAVAYNDIVARLIMDTPLARAHATPWPREPPTAAGASLNRAVPVARGRTRLNGRIMP